MLFVMANRENVKAANPTMSAKKLMAHLTEMCRQFLGGYRRVGGLHILPVGHHEQHVGEAGLFRLGRVLTNKGEL